MLLAIDPLSIDEQAHELIFNFIFTTLKHVI